MFDSGVYWQRRASQYGPRAALHLGHPLDEIEAVTQLQWQAAAAHLRPRLTGNETLSLDFGCGAGRMTHRLATLVGGQAIGVDPTGPLLREAALSTTEQVRFHHNPGGEIPLPTASVDVALVHLVMGGLVGQALQQAAAELARVLKPAAILMVVENTTRQPDQPHWSYRSVEAYHQLFLPRQLEYVGGYNELGERISMLVSGGRSAAAEHYCETRAA